MEIDVLGAMEAHGVGFDAEPPGATGLAACEARHPFLRLARYAMRRQRFAGLVAAGGLSHGDLDDVCDARPLLLMGA